MILASPEEIAWAAGFLEGEGFFQDRTVRKNRFIVGANQVNKEPLERLQELFGGRIYERSRLSNKDGWARRNWWGWELTNEAACLELTEAILPWLSQDRAARIPWVGLLDANPI